MKSNRKSKERTLSTPNYPLENHVKIRPYERLINYAAQSLDQCQIRPPFTSAKELQTPMFPLKLNEKPSLAVPCFIPLEDVIGTSISAEIKEQWKNNDHVDILLEDGWISLIKIKSTDKKLTIPDAIPDHTLFYFPHPTLTATNGGLHKEVYPHDLSVNEESLLHVINWALVESKKTSAPINLPKSITEKCKSWFKLIDGELKNQLFMIEQYGILPNANRAWSIKDNTKRSQISHLPGVIEQFYQFLKSTNPELSKCWLASTGLPLLRKYHKYWQGPESRFSFHNNDLYVGNRWFGLGETAPSEVYGNDIFDRRIHGEHKFYYHRALSDMVKWVQGNNTPKFARDFDLNRVIEKLTEKQIKEAQILSIEQGDNDRSIDFFWNSSKSIEPGFKAADGSIWRLKPLFYSGDRACRTSGKDPIHAWGPYGAFTTDFMTIGQNALLYRQAQILAELCWELGQTDESQNYRQEAIRRKRTLLAFNRDAMTGLFYSYDTYEKRLHTSYLEGDVVYAVYARILDISKIEERVWLGQLLLGIEKNLLGPSGIYGAADDYGLNWEKPHCWPPHQLALLEGLNYYQKMARKLSAKNCKSDMDALLELISRIKKKLIDHYLNASQKEYLETGILAENLNETSSETSTGYQTQEALYSWRATSVLFFYLANLKLEQET